VKNNERVNPQNRICKYCDANCCEDETHFVLDCDLYNDLRSQFFSIVNSKFPSFKSLDKKMKFIWLMSNVDEHIIMHFTKYIYNCFKLRNNTAI